jgi:uncharacterized LabA/DUF88 family protein
LAVFIDWENIYISTVTEYDAKPNVSAILEKAREYGRVVSATAYADWTDGDFRQAPPTLYSNGISPRYISARYFPGGRSQKRRTNSIDVMLAVECSDFLHGHPQVETYVLVTGDGDFIPLVSLLRSRGKKVVVIGVSEATSYHLIESADEFISYASLLEEERAARARDRAPKKKEADPYKELVRAVETLKRSNRPRVLGQVKQQMIVQLGSFDERNAGFKKFKDFVVEAERQGLVNTVDQDLELQVYLPDEEVPETPETDLATEEPKKEAARQNGRGRNGRSSRREDREETAVAAATPEAAEPSEAEESRDGFDLREDLTPYEFKTIFQNLAALGEKLSFVEILGSIRDLDERGELELSEDERREVVGAMLEGGYVTPVREQPYEGAKAKATFYALDRGRDEVKAALTG